MTPGGTPETTGVGLRVCSIDRYHLGAVGD